MKVIDVSQHNSVIDWEKAKDDGIEGVIICAGFGTTYTDNSFIENITGSIKVGLKIWVYWFLYGYGNDLALKNAQKCISLIEPYKQKIILGVSADIYTNQDYYNNKFDMNVLKKYPLWIASYRSEKPNYDLFMWQYSNKGSKGKEVFTVQSILKSLGYKGNNEE